MPFDIYIFFWHFIWMPNEREPLNRRKKEEKNTTTHPIRIENGIHEYESLVFCFSLEFFRSFIRSIFISFYADRRPIASCEMWNIFLTMTVFKSYFVIFVFFVRSFCFFFPSTFGTFEERKRRRNIQAEWFSLQYLEWLVKVVYMNSQFLEQHNMSKALSVWEEKVTAKWFDKYVRIIKKESVSLSFYSFSFIRLSFFASIYASIYAKVK